MVSSVSFLFASCLFLLTPGALAIVVDVNAVRKQNITTATVNPNAPAICEDDPQKYDKCIDAAKPCHCEENRYEMYTYCKRSCGYCARDKMPQRFWRVVNWAPLNRTWYLSEIQFFASKHDKVPLATNDPTKAIASSTYFSFPASHAFDGDIKTAWLPDGWWERQGGGDWIGYDFPQPVDINSVRVISDFDDSSDVSASMLIEAGPTAFGPFQTRWMIVNKERFPDKRFNNPKCPLFWKRFMTDTEAFCYKLVTEYLSWSEARDKCASYGGDLVSINTHEEQAFVQHELLACGYTWLGFNDIEKEKHFRWSDGSPSKFFYWASDEDKDDRMNDMEDCGAMGRDGQWRQFHCKNRFYSFCKKRILTDNDVVIPPNSGSKHGGGDKTKNPDPTLLPSGVDLPPGMTPPPYPTTPTPPPRYPVATTPPPHQQGTAVPTQPPVGGTPPPATGTPPPVAGTPPPAAGTPPPAAGTPLPAAGTPPPAAGTPPPAAGTPPPAAGTPPPVAGAPPVTAPAPAARPVPAPAPAAVPAGGVGPALDDKSAEEDEKSDENDERDDEEQDDDEEDGKEEDGKEEDEEQDKEDEKSMNEDDPSEVDKFLDEVKETEKKPRRKKLRRKHHVKKDKKYYRKRLPEVAQPILMPELDPNEDNDMMNGFLGMVARSNIPKPDVTEKELRSKINKQKMKKAEKELQKEVKKKDKVLKDSSSQR